MDEQIKQWRERIQAGRHEFAEVAEEMTMDRCPEVQMLSNKLRNGTALAADTVIDGLGALS